jgi:hypothetical protein
MKAKLTESKRLFSPEEIDRIIGDPKQVAAEMAEFRASADLFSRGAPPLPPECEGRWVAAYRGEIRVIADTREELSRLAGEAGIPRGKMCVRFAGDRPIII